MLLPTKDPATFRAVVHLSEDDNRRTEAEILVRPLITGINLHYVGHRVYTRPYPGAAWDLFQSFEVDVRPGTAMAALLEARAVAEVYGNTRVFWGAIDA